jgi:hypothetical protein
MQRPVRREHHKKKWREADDWLTLLYALLGSLLAVVAILTGTAMR